jgi:Plasmid pRiA4b ORF-3-like protein
VNEDTELSDLHDVFQQVLGWGGDLGYSFRIHGKKFNSFRRRARSKPLREFRLHRQEKFLYICDLLDMWEWELRVMDIQEGAATEDPDPLCLGGRGDAPPESCGGPRGYRLMLKDRRERFGRNPHRLVGRLSFPAESLPDNLFELFCDLFFCGIEIEKVLGSTVETSVSLRITINENYIKFLCALVASDRLLYRKSPFHLVIAKGCRCTRRT